MAFLLFGLELERDHLKQDPVSFTAAALQDTMCPFPNSGYLTRPFESGPGWHWSFLITAALEAHCTMSAPLGLLVGLLVAVAQLIHVRRADVQTMIRPPAPAVSAHDPHPRSRNCLQHLESNPTRFSALSNQESPISTKHQSAAHAPN